MVEKSAFRRFVGNRYYQTVAAARPLREYLPDKALQRWRFAHKASRLGRLLGEFSSGRGDKGFGPVLVDGMFPIPNYWLRYSLIRAALGLANAREIALVDRAKMSQKLAVVKGMGIREIISYPDYMQDERKAREEARDILSQVQDPVDFFSVKMPFDFPPTSTYDAMLKWQMRPVVDFSHGRMEDFLTEAIQSIHAADKIFQYEKFGLVVLSHPVFGRLWAPLAWRAMQLGIPVIALSARYGLSRFRKVGTGDDIFDVVDGPKAEDLNGLSPEHAAMFHDSGERYLEWRRQGAKSSQPNALYVDLGASYAYERSKVRMTKSDLTQKYGWSPEKPVIAIYARNWWDWPHQFGKADFRDVLDWIEATMAAVQNNREANWLIRPHPSDAVFGGMQASDFLPDREGSHIRLAPLGWNNAAIQDSVDGVVTPIGTIGIEAAALGKPVLLAERGWYGECGFAHWPGSRESYLATLKRPWWTDPRDAEESARRAKIVAAWYFCFPDWQGGFRMADDSYREDLYDLIPDLIEENSEAAEKEISELAAWYESNAIHYHIFKVSRAEKLCF